MSSIWICDGCGKQTEKRFTEFKPYDWYAKDTHEDQRTMTYHACSRDCIEKVQQKYNISGLVAPY